MSHLETKDRVEKYEKLLFGETAVEFQYHSKYTPIIGRLKNGTLLFYKDDRHEIIALKDEGEKMSKVEFNTQSSYFNVKKVAKDKPIEDYIISIEEELEILHPRYNWIIEPESINKLTSEYEELLGECEERVHIPDDFEDRICSKCMDEVSEEDLEISKKLKEVTL